MDIQIIPQPPRFKIILYERTIATAGTYANAQDYIDAYLTGTDWCDAQIEEQEPWLMESHSFRAGREVGLV